MCGVKLSIEYEQDNFVPIVSINGIGGCLGEDVRWEQEIPNRSKKPIKIKANSDPVAFEGTNDSVQSNYLKKYYVGILDGNQLKIHDSCLYSMKVCPSRPVEDISCSHNELLKQFGSKRLRKLNEKLNQQNHSIPEEMSFLSKVTDKAVLESSELIPWNKQANSVDQLYPIHSIIPPEYLHTIHTDIDWLLNSDCPKTVVKVIRKNRRDDPEWSRCLQYLLHLMSLYTSSNKRINESGYFSSGPPPIINELILSLYVVEDESSSRRYAIPKRLKSKLLSHIIVLSLAVNGFKVKAKHLMNDLGLDLKQLISHCRALGCRVVKKTKNKTKIVLRFPLQFPSKSSAFRKKRL